MKKLIWILIISLGVAFAYDGQKEIEVKVKGDKDTGVGLVIKSLEKEQMEKSGAKSGALVLAVLDESSAKEAGLLKNDIVVEANGKKIENGEQLNDIAEALKKGDKLKLTIMRDGAKKSFTTTVQDLISDAHTFSWTEDGDDHYLTINEDDDDFGGDVRVNVSTSDVDDDGPHTFMWHGMDDNSKGGYLGVELDNINDQMKEYFEVENGALIKKVLKDSPAEKAGLKAGDVITKIGDKKIEDTRDVVRTVNFYDPEDEVEINFIRKGDSESVDVKLGKKEHKMSKRMFIDQENAGNDKLFDVQEKVSKVMHATPDGDGKFIKIRKMLKIYII